MIMLPGQVAVAICVIYKVKGPEVVLVTGLQSASTGLLPAWEDDIFHQCLIFFRRCSEMSETD